MLMDPAITLTNLVIQTQSKAAKHPKSSLIISISLIADVSLAVRNASSGMLIGSSWLSLVWFQSPPRIHSLRPSCGKQWQTLKYSKIC